MDDKKSEDYAIKMPEIEMRNYNGRASPTQQEPFLGGARKSTRSSAHHHLGLSNITNSPPISILAYCLASISMTITNKYCVSGANWNLNFFYLAIQVCVLCPREGYVADNR
jgi:GDP-mannose transporter